MGSLHIHKSVLYGLLACVVAGAFYYYYSSSPAAPSPLAATPTAGGATGASILTALSNLQNVRLDSAMFSDAVFQSLTNFGATIPPQPLGRTDPFAPLPGASAGSAALPQNITSGTATKK